MAEIENDSRNTVGFCYHRSVGESMALCQHGTEEQQPKTEVKNIRRHIYLIMIQLRAYR